jgi:hypothetical protein
MTRLVVHHGTVLARRSGPSILYAANRDHLTWPTIEHAVQATDTLLGTLQDRIADLTRAHLGRPRRTDHPAGGYCTSAVAREAARDAQTLADAMAASVSPCQALLLRFRGRVVAQRRRHSFTCIAPIACPSVVDMVSRRLHGVLRNRPMDNGGRRHGCPS